MIQTNRGKPHKNVQTRHLQHRHFKVQTDYLHTLYELSQSWFSLLRSVQDKLNIPLKKVISTAKETHFWQVTKTAFCKPYHELIMDVWWTRCQKLRLMILKHRHLHKNCTCNSYIIFPGIALPYKQRKKCIHSYLQAWNLVMS